MVRSGQLRRDWEAIRRLAGLVNFRGHDLRHSYASLIINLPGASLKLVGDLLGHNRAETSKRYAHLFDETLRQATTAVGGLIANAKTRSTNG